ncbi:extracellular solute-binding protein [Streptomyces sp. WMMB 322]|uniref:extracellular solute-binding protein n=1 Tax=Streptomyces sp. WMMB 322 TaxID=1286821 RepID=UPI0006E1D97D|nr:extracellular solute-binding protein [Streptomyces sp. WMMB 322]SCK06387.1 carbohydrate ABC transporter substrate-binding protein, CUT1 family [Streptomyces sp. WMMB 322]
MADTATRPAHSRRRFLTGLAGIGAAGMGAAPLTGCSAVGLGTGRDVRGLDVWTLTDPVQNKIQRAALARLRRTHPVPAKLTPFPNTGYTQKLRIAMGTSDGPDVFWSWGGESLRPYHDAGLVVDLADRFGKDTRWRDAFLPAALQAARVEGREPLGLPVRGMQPVILFCNQTLFDEHDLRPPRTWDELLDVVDAFVDADVLPVSLAGAESWCELMWLECITMRLTGTGPLRRIFAGERDSWRHPAIEEALDRIQKLVRRGAFGQAFGSVSYGSGGASALFAKGRAAMHLMGSWEYSNLRNDHTRFTEEGLSWVSFPEIPGGTGDPRALVGNNTNYLSVNARSSDIDAGLDLVGTQLAARPFIDALIKAGDVPAAVGIEDRLRDLAPDPDFALYVYRIVSDAPDFTLSWDQAMLPAVKEAMLSSLQQIFLEKLSPRQFVDAMELIQ